MENQKKTGAMLFQLSIDTDTLMSGEVKSETIINGMDVLTSEQQEEVKQHLAEAAGIIITAYQERVVDFGKNLVNKVK